MGSFQSIAGEAPGIDARGIGPAVTGAGEDSLIILQSLLCVLREKNLLTRADLEDLCHKVEMRASGGAENPLPCCAESTASATTAMQRLTNYLGQRYGGKHARSYR